MIQVVVSNLPVIFIECVSSLNRLQRHLYPVPSGGKYLPLMCDKKYLLAVISLSKDQRRLLLASCMHTEPKLRYAVEIRSRSIRIVPAMYCGFIGTCSADNCL